MGEVRTKEGGKKYKIFYKVSLRKTKRNISVLGARTIAKVIYYSA